MSKHVVHFLAYPYHGGEECIVRLNALTFSSTLEKGNKQQRLLNMNYTDCGSAEGLERISVNGGLLGLNHLPSFINSSILKFNCHRLVI